MTATHTPHEPRTAATDVRLVRAAAFASAGAVLGTAGHAAACGGLAWGMVGAGWLFLFSVGTLAAGHRRGPRSIVAATALGQVLFHLLFQLAAAAPAPRVGLALPAAGHLGHATGGLGLSSAMFGAHLAAALAVGAVLHQVETALWRLLGLARRVRAAGRRLAHHLATLLARLAGGPAQPPLPRRPRRRPTPLRSAKPALLTHVLARRGPPTPAYGRP
ncbi:hypothetical protein CFP65_6546 [Kitasatospora sp. MMS16-BH015]|uniref:hypothetical protein n=1 Tax=Kitasatospora sp. MMS16-BH015 TaxID=2018025 RepID=UPI000CA2C9F9|nr:hypothetical protein [Kitasatospora sp. MMS16-BH015]AUG81196.1 hypothetical protein CFP65_6546 [Kitasatospora sp. MMS16-BH015]